MECTSYAFANHRAHFQSAVVNRLQLLTDSTFNVHVLKGEGVLISDVSLNTRKYGKHVY